MTLLLLQFDLLTCMNCHEMQKHFKVQKSDADANVAKRAGEQVSKRRQM